VVLPEMMTIISRSNAKVILCRDSLLKPLLQGGGTTIGRSLKRKIAERKQCLIFVENPRLAVMKLLNKIHYTPSTDKKSRNLQNESATLESSPVVIISKLARIGKNCSIGNFTKIGDKCTIGDNTVVGDCVIIEHNTRIGKNCIIQPGTVIGADGFAYERLEDTLELQRFPHIGGVILGNNVEICSNCSIARGSLSDTIIGEGTKLDALVHIAHNVEIGRHCALTAGTVIGGSTRIGDMCWTGLNSTIKHKVEIGNKVIIGSGASVINDIDDEDIVAGVPAKSIKHKVRSNQLFLMAGQQSRPKNSLKRNSNNNTIGIEK
jgi:UDP-3-O-[3-hydroxymyristoyl] glucosamine N-acyltransferase